ncbi:MAG: hypothetical protein ACRD9Q_11330 [Nitrososphaeraceae archaeon]
MIDFKDSDRQGQLSSLADKVITLLQREGIAMSVDVVQRSVIKDPLLFKSVLKFLLDFDVIKYDTNTQTIKLSKVMRATKR